MNFVSVTYSQRSNVSPDDWTEFLHTIKKLGDWQHPIASMWLLFTEYTAEEVYSKLEKISEKCFEIYHITDFNPSNMHGRLLSATWAWIEQMSKNMKTPMDNDKIQNVLHVFDPIAVLDIINKFPDLLHRAQNGDDKAKHELVGQCMRQSGGKLNPTLVRQYIDNMEALVKAAEKEHETERLIQI